MRLWTALRPTALLLTCTLVACSNKLDQAAKQRIFSPEEPAADVQRANETLRPAEAASDGALWSRVWKMDRLEVTHRIGAHRAKANVHFRWSRAGRTIELTEDQVFETQKDGSFHATVTNDQDSGFEFVWAKGQAFARGRYGPFHERRTDRAQQDVFREQGTSALRTIFGLFKRRLHGAPLGGDSGKGTRFALSLGDAWGPEAASDPLRPVFGQVRAQGKDGKEALQPGPDEDTARRLELDALEEPTKVSGEILVGEAGVILKADIKSKFKVAPAANTAPAVLEVEVTYDLKPDESVHVTAPTDVVSLKLPHAVNDPLWFTGNGAAPARDEDEETENKADERADDRADDEAPTTAPSKPAKAPAPADKGTRKP